MVHCVILCPNTFKIFHDISTLSDQIQIFSCQICFWCARLKRHPLSNRRDHTGRENCRKTLYNLWPWRPIVHVCCSISLLFFVAKCRLLGLSSKLLAIKRGNELQSQTIPLMWITLGIESAVVQHAFMAFRISRIRAQAASRRRFPPSQMTG